MAHDILIVDDEDDIRFQIAGILNDEGYDTREANGDVAALREIEFRRPSLVILDIWLEGSQRDGLELLKLVQQEHPDVPVIIISGHGTIEMAVQAIKLGAYEFVEKPFKADRLLLILHGIDEGRIDLVEHHIKGQVFLTSGICFLSYPNLRYITTCFLAEIDIVNG